MDVLLNIRHVAVHNFQSELVHQRLKQLGPLVVGSDLLSSQYMSLPKHKSLIDVPP